MIFDLDSPKTALYLQSKYERSLSSVGSEHLPYKQGVTGSNPVGTTNKVKTLLFFYSNIFRGFLAQLVQSIWFTPRGSGVRIPQDPQSIFCFTSKIWSLSSVGSEHLPYKQGVTGSNPVGTTKKSFQIILKGFFI